MKICILAAGKGSRMGVFADAAHKALLPLDNKAIIGRIIEQFTDTDEFVIALGYKKEQVKDYLTIAYPKRKFTFVDVDNYDGPGSGPGCSLFACRQHLQEPFVFTACDTLVLSPLPTYQQNWMGVKKVDNIQQWCSVKVGQQKQVTDIFYKEKVDAELAFVGIAFVNNVASFWGGLERNTGLLGGELQVNNGLQALLAYGLNAVELEWEDAGNEVNYGRLLKKYTSNFSFDGKTTDITYHHDNRIIKFFANAEHAKSRYQRGLAFKGVFADVTQWQGNFYAYRFQAGSLLSARINAFECAKFLEWSQQNLWRDVSVSSIDFSKLCYAFYFQKTLGRLNDFCRKLLPCGEIESVVINGQSCLPVAKLLSQLSSQFYAQGLPSTYHGDLHDDNVICTPDSSYVLIDWRESFGACLEAGDRYYDLAKFLHTLNFSVIAMKNKAYQVLHDGHKVSISHDTSANGAAAIVAFNEFAVKYRYDLRRIRIIEALIYINMSPLYANDLGQYLYYLGRYLLQRELIKT